MGRRRIFSDEERKERKKAYDIKYQNKRYNEDPEFREMKNRINNANYHKTKKRNNVEIEIHVDNDLLRQLLF